MVNTSAATSADVVAVPIGGKEETGEERGQWNLGGGHLLDPCPPPYAPSWPTRAHIRVPFSRLQKRSVEKEKPEKGTKKGTSGSRRVCNNSSKEAKRRIFWSRKSCLELMGLGRCFLGGVLG